MSLFLPFDSFDQNVSKGIVRELQITNVAAYSTAVPVCLTMPLLLQVQEKR